jgi:hypothetical protein
MANGDIENTSRAATPTQVPSNPAPAVVPGVMALSGISRLLSSSSSKQFKLPLPNPLHKYASYTQIFTIAALSTEDLNSPNTTYLASGKLPIILKTAGGNPNNRIKTFYGKFDFFVDSLEIESTYGFELGTGNTNATAINMVISEPFSIGMFPVALNTACKKYKYASYSVATFLLKIEFKGEDQNGNMVSLPNTTKMIPFIINDLTMQVTNAGAIYNIKATPAGQVPLFSNNNTITTDMSIAGSTVQEILQTGPYSLQAAINAGYRAQAAKNELPIPAQEILIIFPKSSANESLVATPKGEDERERDKPAAAEVKPLDDANTNAKLNVSRSSINNTLVESSVNEIGASSLGFGTDRWPASTLQQDSIIIDSKTGKIDPAKISKNPKVSNYSFKQTSTIVNAINQVIMSSEYALKCISDKPEGDTKMRKWWRIETALYHVDSPQLDKKTKKKPELLVFKVMPYLVHETSIPTAGTTSTSFKSMLAQCVKVYNYIYTGKNQDILKLDIKFNNSFNVSNPVDNGNNTTDSRVAEQNDQSKPKRAENAPREGGGTIEPGFGLNYTEIWNSVKTAFNYRGGAGGDDTTAQQQVKWVHEALTFGADLQELEMDIVGDPYYMTSNGMGNFNSPPVVGQMNINSDGSINFQSGEVDIGINFRTPTDINSSTGLLTMANKAVGEFSGLFRLGSVTHRFRDGEFTQTIKGTRRQMVKDPKTGEAVYQFVSKIKKPTT